MDDGPVQRWAVMAGGPANKFSQPSWHGRGLWQLEAPAGGW